MKTMDKIINEDIFLNAYEICKSYAESKVMNDINFLLLKKSLLKLSERNIKDYYKDYICKDIFYGNPVLFANDIVHIPKGIDGFREYRFFDLYSMLLYNSVGILFYKMCNASLRELNPEKDNIYKFAPTIFNDNENSKLKYSKDYIPVKANKDYRDDYSKYLNKLKEKIVKGKCLIKMDLSRYFDSIPHDKLINLIEKYSYESTLSKYEYDKETVKSLQFYFESMMNSKYGIPQGRDNCFSDYYGDIYLRQLDFEIKKICENENIKFDCMIRYVDDMTIVFDINKNIDVSKHYKEMSTIAQKISKYLLNTLELTINSSKTKFMYLDNDDIVKEYLTNETKKVSTKDNIKISNIDLMYNNFKNTLEKFKFCSENNYSFSLSGEDRENLKNVFNKQFVDYLKVNSHIEEINSIIQKIDIELTTDSMYVLIILFFLESNKKRIFFNKFKDNLNKNLSIFDKRTIHISMLCYTQKENLKHLRKKIKDSEKELSKDNYGKYLIPLADYYSYESVSYLDENSIYNIISWRHLQTDKVKTVIPKESGESIYNSLFNNIIINKKNDDKNINDALIQQLIDFVYYYRKSEWNLAYNSFYNFFHELCKISFMEKNNNKYDIKSIISDLYKSKVIDQKKELILNKFADCRNFNSISHPSKNGKKSIKVSRENLDFYINEISKIICDVLRLKK